MELPLPEWLSELVGPNIGQAGFYKKLFEDLINFPKVYPTDYIKSTKNPDGWPGRSVRRYIARLADGNERTLGLGILERRKEGYKGRVYYHWSPIFYARINQLWRVVKKGLK